MWGHCGITLIISADVFMVFSAGSKLYSRSMAQTGKLSLMAGTKARDFALSPGKTMICKLLKSTHGPDIQEERFIRPMLFAILEFERIAVVGAQFVFGRTPIAEIGKSSRPLGVSI